MTFFLILAVSSIIAAIGGFFISMHVRLMRSIEIAKKGGFLVRIRTKLPQYVSLKDSLFHLNDIPAHLILLLIFHEDDRFFVHRGFNYPELWSSLKESFRTGRRKGGSSITQQLARTLFCASPQYSPRGVVRKLYEVVATLYLERHLTKLEILALYLDRVTVWRFSQGVKQAAIQVFQKEPKDLRIPESEIIVSFLPGDYRFLDSLARSPWQEPVFDVLRSYEKLLVFQRWFQKHFPDRSYSILESLPLTHEELFDLLFKAVPVNLEQSPSLEEKFQRESTRAIEAILQLLPSKSTGSLPLLHRYCSADLELTLSLLYDSKSASGELLHRHLLVASSEEAWNGALHLIEKHGIAGQLQHCSFPELLPTSFVKRLKLIQNQEVASHLRQQSAFVSLQRLIHDSIRIIHIKGIDLHERLYRTQGPRPGGDLDIFVSMRDYTRLCGILRRERYVKVIGTSDDRDLFLARWIQHSVVWREPLVGVLLDVHVLPENKFSRYMENAERRVMSAPHSDVYYYGLRQRALLQYLCQHAAKHGWSRLFWLVDLDRLFTSFPDQELQQIFHSKKSLFENDDVVIGMFFVRNLLRFRGDAALRVRNTIHHSVITRFSSVIRCLSPINSTQFAGWSKLHYTWHSYVPRTTRLARICSYLFVPTLNDLPSNEREVSLLILFTAAISRPIRGLGRFLRRAGKKSPSYPLLE